MHVCLEIIRETYGQGKPGGTYLFSGAEDIATGTTIGTVVFLAAAGVLTVISLILTLIGLRKAGIDEDSFDNGFVWAVLCLILTVAGAVLGAMNIGSGVADNILHAITSVLKLGVYLYVVRGIGTLADRIGNEKMLNMGRNIYIIMCVLLIINAIINLLPIFFRASQALATAESIFTTLASVISIVSYIVYLIYLGKAKKMLKNA